jgi:steroid delta-isomerase-like uncharacterized protein
MTSKEELLRLEQECIQAWDQQDADGFLSLLADDCVVTDDTEPSPMRTRDDVRRYMESWFTAFPDGRCREINRVIGDESAAVEIEISGTNTGPLDLGGNRIPPTGKKVTTTGSIFMKTENGRIKEIHSHADNLSMMSQLGLAGASA